MKLTALAGLFVATALLATSAYAADDLCTINLQKIENAQATAPAQSEGLKNDIDALVAKAEAAHAKGTAAGTKDCEGLTAQALQKIADDKKGDK
jgi:hypothetical protein